MPHHASEVETTPCLNDRRAPFISLPNDFTTRLPPPLYHKGERTEFVAGMKPKAEILQSTRQQHDNTVEHMSIRNEKTEREREKME